MSALQQQQQKNSIASHSVYHGSKELQKKLHISEPHLHSVALAEHISPKKTAEGGRNFSFNVFSGLF